jgi:hypothetical protein
MRLLLLLCGCWDLSAVVDPPTVNPGGKVQASLVGGLARTTAAVAHGKSEPMVVEGASAELTFSLTAARTVGLNGTALTDLKKPGDSTQLDIMPGDANHLEIHLDGGGCVAQSGTVSLSLDGSSQLAGSFQAQGTISGGSAACQMMGTLSGIPQDR